MEDMLSNEITQTFLLFHRGIKFQDDFEVVKNFVDQYGESTIDTYVTLPYCHVTFKEAESAKKMIA
jgi:hypothetical protein